MKYNYFSAEILQRFFNSSRSHYDIKMMSKWL